MQSTNQPTSNKETTMFVTNTAATYKIQINEGQRRIISLALLAFGTNARQLLSSHDGGLGAYDTELEEFRALCGMFQSLPEVALECPPDTLHGFCF